MRFEVMGAVMSLACRRANDPSHHAATGSTSHRHLWLSTFVLRSTWLLGCSIPGAARTGPTTETEKGGEPMWVRSASFAEPGPPRGTLNSMPPVTERSDT